MKRLTQISTSTRVSKQQMVKNLTTSAMMGTRKYYTELDEIGDGAEDDGEDLSQVETDKSESHDEMVDTD